MDGDARRLDRIRDLCDGPWRGAQARPMRTSAVPDAPHIGRDRRSQGPIAGYHGVVARRRSVFLGDTLIMLVKGKAALVTGGAGRIGRGIAATLRREGAAVGVLDNDP